MIIKRPDSSYEYRILSFIQFIFGFLVPAVAVAIVLLLSSGISTDSNFLAKLLFYVASITATGFWVLWFKVWETWDEAFGGGQIGKYYSLPGNVLMTIELGFPDDFNYDPAAMKSFLSYFKNVFRSMDITRSNQYQYGKWHSGLAIDYVLNKGHLKIYMTFAKKKYAAVIEGLARLFPGIIVTEVVDPFKDMPKSWDDSTQYDGYDQCVGYNFGLSESNMHPLLWANDVPTELGVSPLDNFITSCKETLKDEVVFFQLALRADKKLPYPRLHQEYQMWMQKLFYKFAPTNLIDPNNKRETPDGSAFTGIIPEAQRTQNEAINYRTHTILCQSSFRVVALCKKRQTAFVENTLEKLGRVFYGGTSVIDQGFEKKHITATNQRFFRNTDKQPESQEIYSGFWFPDEKWGYQSDIFWGNLMNNYYYPRENKYRRKIIWECLMKRDLTSPWNGNNTLLDPVSFAGIFQWPVAAMTDKKSLQNRIKGTLTHKKFAMVFEANDDD